MHSAWRVPMHTNCTTNVTQCRIMRRSQASYTLPCAPCVYPGGQNAPKCTLHTHLEFLNALRPLSDRLADFTDKVDYGFAQALVERNSKRSSVEECIQDVIAFFCIEGTVMTGSGSASAWGQQTQAMLWPAKLHTMLYPKLTVGCVSDAAGPSRPPGMHHNHRPRAVCW